MLASRRLTPALLALVGVGLLGCPPAAEKPLPPPPPATITAFSVTPAVVARPGDSVTLQWTVTDATAVSLEQVGVGPVAISAGATSATAVVNTAGFFVLSARGEGGTDAQVLAVRIAAAASTTLFSAIPSSVKGGEPTVLVWNAPGAQAVSLEEVGGGPIAIGTQKETGSVTVTPAHSTSYRLTVDGHPTTVDVVVTPTIAAFALDGDAPAAGASARLVWTTFGATRVTVTRAGAAAAIATVTDPVKVASGDVTDTIPAALPVDGVVTWTLDAESGSTHVTRDLVIRVSGAVKIASFTVPAFLKDGQAGSVSWSTTGGEALTFSIDGQVIFVASSQTEVNAGNVPVVGTSATQQLELVVRNSRGAVARSTKTIAPVGLPVFSSFTATPATVSTPGGAVQLAWDVTNARHVRISEVGGFWSAARSGLVDTGTISVTPNRPSVTYKLEADNQAGDAIAPHTTTVTVTNPITVTVSRRLPPGLTTQVTGASVPVSAVYGLPIYELNRIGEAFVDISTSGTAITFDGTDYGKALLDIGDFDARIFGAPIAAPTVSVSTDGWLVFSPVAVTGPTTPAVPVGTQAEPLAVLALWWDLQVGSASKAVWKVDQVNGARRLIVQWSDFNIYGVSSSRLTFQAQIYESGKVVTAYQTLDGVTGTPVTGVVNRGETAVLGPTTSPVAGQTVTFFPPVSSYPVAHVVQPAPYWATVELGGAFIPALLEDSLAVGDLAFSEINPRPLATLTNAQWIELTNNSNQFIDLQGWTLSLGGTNTHTIGSSVVVPANGRVLLAQATDLGDAFTATPVAYTYPAAFAMGATGTLSLLPPTSTTAYARIDWTATTAPTAGVSVRADPPNAGFRFSTSLTAPTCPSTAGTYGTSAQTGTPGASQPRCFPYTLQPLSSGAFESIATTGTQLVLASAPASDESVFTVTLPQAVTLFGAPTTTLYVSTNGWISATATTAPTSSNRTSPSTTPPVGSIAPYWDSLLGLATAPAGAMAWVQRDPDGTPASGDEVTIVSWEGWRSSLATSGDSMSFQVKFLGNGALEYWYGDMVGTSSYHRGLSATSWLENPAGTTALSINVNSSTAPGIAPNTGFRFTPAP